MNYFNLKNRTVHAKTVESKVTLKQYYGIGTNKQVLDYEGKTRIEAHGFFEMEFASMGANLEYLGTYSR